MGIFRFRLMLLCLIGALSYLNPSEGTFEYQWVADENGSFEYQWVADENGFHMRPRREADVHCGVPANISHGHYEYLSHHDDDTYLSVIKYVCDGPVYHLEDPEEAVYICTEQNKWKNAKLKYKLPECHKVSCGVPKDIEHGHFDYVTTHGVMSYLSMIKYTCDTNYHERDFSDEGVYVCTIEGKWRNTDLDFEIPTCEPGINLPLRKIVCLLSPDKEISQNGDHIIIRTLTGFRNYIMEFDIGIEFIENLEAVDGRKCQTTVCWDGDRMVCTQRGEKQDRGWTHWLEGDTLHLELRAEGVVAKQEFRRKK